MTDDRDRQSSKVYAWEERFVAARDPTSIAFAQAQGMADTIWTEFGLHFPPRVERLPRQARSTMADASPVTTSSMRGWQNDQNRHRPAE
jgi:hypothetical protein